MCVMQQFKETALADSGSCSCSWSHISGQLERGFGWDRVNLLPSSGCSAVFWIEEENNVDNTLGLGEVSERLCGAYLPAGVKP